MCLSQSFWKAVVLVNCYYVHGYVKKKEGSVRQPHNESLVVWRMYRLSISWDSSLIPSVSETVGLLPAALLSGGRISEKEEAEHLTCLCSCAIMKKKIPNSSRLGLRNTAAWPPNTVQCADRGKRQMSKPLLWKLLKCTFISNLWEKILIRLKSDDSNHKRGFPW